MPTGNGATDVNGASQRLSALLTEPLPTEDSAEVQDEPEEETEVTEDAETESEPEETPEGDTEPERYKVKVNGEDLEVTLEDLQKGYMMEGDYRRKTSSLAKEREAIEAKAAEVDAQLEEARLLLDNELASIDSKEMLELKKYDPEAYLEKYDAIQAKAKKFEALKSKREDDHKSRQEKLVAKEREALMIAFPQWNDQQVMQKEGAELMKGLKDLGFTDGELSNLTDHRLFILADKARKLDSIMKQDIGSKKVKGKPMSVKPGSTTEKADRVAADAKKARERLRKSGNIRDAVNLLRT